MKAALADYSSARRQTRNGLKFHIMLDDETAACYPAMLLLAEFTALPLDEVQPNRRCTRPKCAKHWETR